MRELHVVFARRLGISLSRLNEIVLGKRSVTADTALRLARFLETSPQLWMRLQADWDLRQVVQRAARKACCLIPLPKLTAARQTGAT